MSSLNQPESCLYDRACEAAAFIAGRTSLQPTIAVVLGSGLGGFASQLDNLIQATNILGSIFYGPMLGVFLVGFFVKGVKGTAAFWATVVAQGVVVAVFAASSIGYLWYNVIGCAVVLLLAPALSLRRALI